MIHVQPPAETDPDDDLDEAREVWRERVLREMAELDLALMRALTGQALARVEAGEAAGDAAQAASRAARSLRLTLALEERFAKARRARLADVAAEEAVSEAEEQHAATRRELRLMFRKHKVMSIVEEAIGGEAEGERAEALLIQLTERLEAPEDEADFHDRPYGELAARICRELGLDPDWSLWANEPWAREEAEYRERSGSPFARPGWRVKAAVEVPVGEAGEEDPP